MNDASHPHLPQASMAQTPAMNVALVVMVLTGLFGLQPVTTDLYLPTLPSIAADLSTPVGQVQMTLSGLLLAFGFSQLVWGPASDRFGRKPVLVVGLMLYLVAITLATMASDIDTLILWRVVQGIAMGAAIMSARAVVRDLYDPIQGARILSKGHTGLGVMACASAPIGGLVSQYLNWRYALVATGIYAFMLLLLVVFRFQETLRAPNQGALNPRHQIRIWGAILCNPTFLTHSALTTGTYTGLFTFLASSSFVFIKLMGLSKLAYGFLMFMSSLSYIGGTFLCRSLLQRMGLRRTVMVGGVLSLTGGALLVVLAWAGNTPTGYGPWAVALPMYIYMLGHGIHQPCGQSGAVSPFPQAAGAASALNGCMMMLFAFVMSHWLGTQPLTNVWPLAKGVLFSSIWIALIAWTLVPRYGIHHEAGNAS